MTESDHPLNRGIDLPTGNGGGRDIQKNRIAASHRNCVGQWIASQNRLTGARRRHAWDIVAVTVAMKPSRAANAA